MLKTRILTALILLPLFLGLLFLATPGDWLIFCAVIAGLAGWEWGALAGMPVRHRPFYCAALAAHVFVVYKMGPQVVLLHVAVASLFWVLVVPAWLRNRWRLSGAATGFVCGILVIVPTALALASLREQGAWLLLALMAVVWVADTAAYFAGRAFGRHKLAPQISPGKTREGAYGALLGVLLYGFVIAPRFSDGAFQMTDWVSLAGCLVALTVLSILGDLFESLLKRHAGLKDSGRLLPGHGGILDRIDSLTSTLPFAATGFLLMAGQ